jgi:DnaJ-class molecular chaperone
VKALRARIAQSKLATFFHADEDVVCQGCHHHSPVGETPPYCGSCHGAPFDPEKPEMPGLYGAYHQQCIGCHQEMGIGATGCNDCHAPKGE